MDGVHDLVQRARQRDRATWQALHDLVRPYLLRRAQRLLGPGWPYQSVSDLIQETLLRAWAGIENFHGGKDDAQTGAILRAWLGRIMKNLHANGRRDDQAQQRKPPGLVHLDALLPGGSSSAGGLELPSDEPTPSTNLRGQEQQARIQEVLARLEDPRDRDLLRLFFFEGLSRQVIAGRLGLTYDQVRYRFHLLLKQLGEELQELRDD